MEYENKYIFQFLLIRTLLTHFVTLSQSLLSLSHFVTLSQSLLSLSHFVTLSQSLLSLSHFVTLSLSHSLTVSLSRHTHTHIQPSW
jgi:hypothetical protein